VYESGRDWICLRRYWSLKTSCASLPWFRAQTHLGVSPLFHTPKGHGGNSGGRVVVPLLFGPPGCRFGNAELRLRRSEVPEEPTT
jgi:hypothetical protein